MACSLWRQRVAGDAKSSDAFLIPAPWVSDSFLWVFTLECAYLCASILTPALVLGTSDRYLYRQSRFCYTMEPSGDTGRTESAGEAGERMITTPGTTLSSNTCSPCLLFPGPSRGRCGAEESVQAALDLGLEGTRRSLEPLLTFGNRQDSQQGPL